MKTLLLGISIILASVVSVVAQQNPSQSPYGYGQQQQREPVLKYNPYESEWSYEKPGETLQYNPYGNKWEYAPPDSELRYNPYENRWERD